MGRDFCWICLGAFYLELTKTCEELFCKTAVSASSKTVIVICEDVLHKSFYRALTRFYICPVFHG